MNTAGGYEAISLILIRSSKSLLTWTTMLHVDIATGEVLVNRLAGVMGPGFAAYSRGSAFSEVPEVDEEVRLPRPPWTVIRGRRPRTRGAVKRPDQRPLPDTKAGRPLSLLETEQRGSGLGPIGRGLRAERAHYTRQLRHDSFPPH
jgi:hypothetical protein